MRLEITVDGGKPFYFPLTKDVIILGSSGTADIKIPQMHVSRKHLAVHRSGDKFYVEDLGSTNGSFVNDEKLEPSRKREFTSFFPIRMGSVVFIALVPDEEDDYQGSAAPVETSLASLAERSDALATSKQHRATAELQAKSDATRTVAIGKRLPPTLAKRAQKQNQSLVLQLGALVLVVATAAYYFYSENQAEAQAELQSQARAQAETSPSVAPSKQQEQKPPTAPSEAIADDDFLSRAEMDTIVARVKCVTEMEKALCTSIDGAGVESWGATEVDEQMVIVVDGSTFYEQAKKVMPVPDEIKNGTATVLALEAHDDHIWKLAASLFIKRSLSKMPYDKLKEDLLIFGLFHRKDGKLRLGAEIVGQADQFQNVSMLTGTKLLNDVAATGPGVLTILDRYYRFKSSELQ